MYIESVVQLDVGGNSPPSLSRSRQLRESESRLTACLNRVSERLSARPLRPLFIFIFSLVTSSLFLFLSSSFLSASLFIRIFSRAEEFFYLVDLYCLANPHVISWRDHFFFLRFQVKAKKSSIIHVYMNKLLKNRFLLFYSWANRTFLRNSYFVQNFRFLFVRFLLNVKETSLCAYGKFAFYKIVEPVISKRVDGRGKSEAYQRRSTSQKYARRSFSLHISPRDLRSLVNMFSPEATSLITRGIIAFTVRRWAAFTPMYRNE